MKILASLHASIIGTDSSAHRYLGAPEQWRAGAAHVRFTAAVLVFLLLAIASRAAEIPHTFTKVGPEYRLAIEPNPALYFDFQYTDDLLQPFGTIKMALGDTEAIFGYTPLATETQGFFRAEGISVFAPRDSDFDGMDDVWELQHPYLDPLNPNDALLPSPHLAGKTNFEEYLLHFNYSAAKPQYYSREASVYNFGAPVFATEAISREVALFNFGSPPSSLEALSREVSLYNGEAFPIADYPQIYSREASVFNSPPSLTSAEAFSHEVSVFNGEQIPAPDYPQIYSREVSVFNSGTPINSIEAISREVSIINNLPN